MNKKERPTPLVEEHLRAVQSLEEAATDAYFYTRLRARMERASSAGQSGWVFTLRPVWVIGGLLLLLALNGYMLRTGAMTSSSAAPSSGMDAFAASYNQTLTEAY